MEFLEQPLHFRFGLSASHTEGLLIETGDQVMYECSRISQHILTKSKSQNSLRLLPSSVTQLVIHTSP
jgi:hypothetical protein